MHGQRPQHGDDRDLLIKALVAWRNPALTEALTERDEEHGLTLLGLAVAWGHETTVKTLVDACKCALATLLTHSLDTLSGLLPVLSRWTLQRGPAWGAINDSKRMSVFFIFVHDRDI